MGNYVCYGQLTTKVVMNDMVIYFDPLVADEKADLIFLSGDEKGFDPKIIKKLKKASTVIVAPSFLEIDSQHASPKDVFSINDLSVSVIPAYYIEQALKSSERTKNGYLVTGNKTIYFAGPTDVIPEMNIIDADIAFIPVITKYTTLFQALAASNVVHANLFVPIAYSETDKEGLENCILFTRKCIYPSDIARDTKSLPEVPISED